MLANQVQVNGHEVEPEEAEEAKVHEPGVGAGNTLLLPQLEARVVAAADNHKNAG